MTQLVPAPAPAQNANNAIMERVLIEGDLSKLTPYERVQYYMKVCESVGLNPLTKPFDYLFLNNKLVLYANRNCTDQLRFTRQVSTTITAREKMEDIYVVSSRAVLPDGRQDEAIGAVSISGLKGEALANAMMKAETKSKRRVTLSVCGLGWLDETEISSIPDARPVTVDENGEIIGTEPPRRAIPAPPQEQPGYGNAPTTTELCPLHHIAWREGQYGKFHPVQGGGPLCAENKLRKQQPALFEPHPGPQQ